MNFRAVLFWFALSIAIFVPIVLAANSELLQWRQPIYILAGFAGIVAMALLLVQPLLVGGYMPGFHVRRARLIHRMTGLLLVIAVVMHVGALWVTSPPDVIDALLFVSPTPFSDFGVIAMWAVFGAALLALVRKRAHLSPKVWRVGHTLFVVIAVLGSVAHAMLIEGTMEFISKTALCVLVLVVTVKVAVNLRVWALLKIRNRQN